MISSSIDLKELEIGAVRECSHVADEVESIWFDLCRLFNITESIAGSVWITLSVQYQEEGRFYHTLEHIHSLLKLNDSYRKELVDPGVVMFAIFFHDIIYDPKSKFNEEDSSAVFAERLNGHLDEAVIQKVCHYINETKKHDVLSSEDTDLKYFVDFDMSILGSDRQTYQLYCQAIRKEYAHYPDEAYCNGRTAFLRGTVNEGKRIFATEEFFTKYEETAKSNILWECELLESGRLV